MTPTEHEGTVAVDAAARKMYADVNAGLDVPEFDHLHPVQQNVFRDAVLPYVWAGLEALPDRAVIAWDEGEVAGRQNYESVYYNGFTEATIIKNPHR
jgi:hypothetical protein